MFNINVTARVWNCTLLLIQELSLVDAVVLKAAIVLGDSPWLGLNHRACCYPEATMKRQCELWNICYRQIAEWDLQSWGRVAWEDVAKIKWRGENEEKVKKKKKKASVTKRECEQICMHKHRCFKSSLNMIKYTNYPQFMMVINLIKIKTTGLESTHHVLYTTNFFSCRIQATNTWITHHLNCI